MFVDELKELLDKFDDDIEIEFRHVLSDKILDLQQDIYVFCDKKVMFVLAEKYYKE